jgi:ribosomal-protein-alanine N-acetyltransferase
VTAGDQAAVIHTPQLLIAPLDLPAMRALLDDRRDDATAAVGAQIPDGWSLENEGWLRVRIGQVEQDPSWAPWLLRSIIRRADRMLLGTVGFHGPPGSHPLEPESAGVVEFGYTVIDRFRGNGYATQAAGALMDWGIDFGARSFVLSIALDNQASRRVAEKLGFEWEREYTHESRGQENLFSRTP